MAPSAIIFGLSGLDLTQTEFDFFRSADPWAFILFARNIDTPLQVKRLCQDLRDCIGRDCLIFVDQEGGRVQRLTEPHWRKYPSYACLARHWHTDPRKAKQAVYLHHRLIAHDLYEVGITANCAPVLDIPVEGADEIISDRAFGRTISIVTDLADAAMLGCLRGGVVPVIKHIPGHGRAQVDSHKALPTITARRDELDETDFASFRAFARSPMAMTAHAVFTCVDETAPITLSKTAIQKLIRDDIGFEGLLMSDDLDMKALSGSMEMRTRQALKAGCDVVLQCSGDMLTMEKVTKGACRLSGASLMRAHIAEKCSTVPVPFDYDFAQAQFDRLIRESQNAV